MPTLVLNDDEKTEVAARAGHDAVHAYRSKLGCESEGFPWHSLTDAEKVCLVEHAQSVKSQKIVSIAEPECYRKIREAVVAAVLTALNVHVRRIR